MQVRTMVMAAAMTVAPGLLYGQFDFHVDGRDVQIHSFVQQGFAYTNQNNYLTMNTSQGSGAMTDGGVNVSTRLTDHFRVGGQAYFRNIGDLGNYKVTLDWAFADYQFKSWFGIRGGKVKSALGLFNDTQDMEFLHTWAILPQSVYPLDLRSNTIAHTGGDVYGTVSLRKAGSLSYTGYFGARTNDPRGGYYYSVQDAGIPVRSFSGTTGGVDMRWTTPIQGLMAGTSWVNQTEDLEANIIKYRMAPISVSLDPQHITAVYGDYQHGNWHFNTEFRKNYTMVDSTVLGANSSSNESDWGWFATAAYRVNKRLELGTYYSRYHVDHPHVASPDANHIYDNTVTARFDITKFWSAKIEGHFIDGYGDTYSAHGFYTRSNPNGLKPTTNMLVIRTAWSF